ncbi:cip1-interacting zinc finger protein-like [Lampris incognitus]|uniref:cip1-interacting zinc finger protein-like n=1 Tax=Lampris incognitus TaxID=2546036 RepID=UPI0024B5463B|nr:cip1-interacting zinc finger protein-like [Lampris incognitus]XP_056144903.1 cip1-interacting zinc finger protein-like [Lampris incognitus]
MKRQRLGGEGEAGVLASGEKVQGPCDPQGSKSFNCRGVSTVLSAGGTEPPPGQQEAAKCCEDSRAAEVQSLGSCLRVIIQQSSESRAFRQTETETNRLTDTQTDGYYCHICKSNCLTLLAFQNHMKGEEHQRRLKEITNFSTACPSVHTHSRGRRPNIQRWCDTCQSHFTGDVILHRRTSQHKMCKRSSRPFCTACKRHFRTPRKFVEHMKSPQHKQQVHFEEVLEEELITVDAIGCFEGEEEVEEEEDGGEKDDVIEEPDRGEATDGQDFDPHTTYGSSFVVPVSGFLCQLCHKFFHHETTARQRHCQTHTHYLNLQKHRARREQEYTAGDESHRHTSEAIQTDEHRDTVGPTATDRQTQRQT